MNDTPIAQTPAAEVERCCRAAATAGAELADLAAWPPSRRAGLLRDMAEVLDANAQELASGMHIAFLFLAGVAVVGASVALLTDRGAGGTQARPAA